VIFSVCENIPKYIDEDIVIARTNPEFEQCVKSHIIERLNVRSFRKSDSTWQNASSVGVEFGQGEEYSVHGGSDLRMHRWASTFDSLPLSVRLANRKYSFVFVDTFSHENAKLGVSYSFLRPDGSRVVVDTVINYRWEARMFVPVY
jgi:hypothetical protein